MGRVNREHLKTKFEIDGVDSRPSENRIPFEIVDNKWLKKKTMAELPNSHQLPAITVGAAAGAARSIFSRHLWTEPFEHSATLLIEILFMVRIVFGPSWLKTWVYTVTGVNQITWQTYRTDVSEYSGKRVRIIGLIWLIDAGKKTPSEVYRLYDNMKL